jgi:hypothetical protein
MENTGTLTTAARNKMALMNGLILGVIHVVISTAVNMTVDNAIMFNVLKMVAYINYMVILFILARNIRKANGGYIEFREVFGASFVMLLVAGTITYLYSYLYMFMIIPDFADRIKNASIKLLESNTKLSDEIIDEKIREIEKQMKEANELGIGKLLLNYLSTLLMDCVFGLIVCAIVKKPRPLFD